MVAVILPQTGRLEHPHLATCPGTTGRRQAARRAIVSLLVLRSGGWSVMSADSKLQTMGLVLPEIPRPVANYVPFKINGNTLYLSGQGPRRNDGTMLTGKVGRDVT